MFFFPYKPSNFNCLVFSSNPTFDKLVIALLIEVIGQFNFDKERTIEGLKGFLQK